MSLAASQLLLAVMGGAAIAGERADRSAEILAYLPAGRMRRLIFKLAIVATTAATGWAVYFLMGHFVYSAYSGAVSPAPRRIRNVFPLTVRRRRDRSHDVRRGLVVVGIPSESRPGDHRRRYPPLLLWGIVLITAGPILFEYEYFR